MPLSLAESPAGAGAESLEWNPFMPKLDWLIRSEDEKDSARVPYRLLEAVPEHS